MNPEACYIREATMADLAFILQAEQVCFPLDSWQEEAIASQLTSAIGRSFVAECDGVCVGYALVQMISPEWDILRIAILPSHRQQGRGKQLLLAVHNKLLAEGGTKGYLEVRASNHAAISLYTSCGYTPCGTRKQYYHHPTEDACLLSFGERGQ